VHRCDNLHTLPGELPFLAGIARPAWGARAQRPDARARRYASRVGVPRRARRAGFLSLLRLIGTNTREVAGPGFMAGQGCPVPHANCEIIRGLGRLSIDAAISLDLAGTDSKKTAPMAHRAGSMRSYVPEGRLSRITLVTRATPAPWLAAGGYREPSGKTGPGHLEPGRIFYGAGAGFRASPAHPIRRGARIHCGTGEPLHLAWRERCPVAAATSRPGAGRSRARGDLDHQTAR